MPGVIRDGDVNSAGGAAKSSVTSVIVNNKPIVVDSTSVLPHPPYKGPHKSAKTSGGLSNVIAENKPVNVKDNPDTCGHPRQSCSDDVIAG